MTATCTRTKPGWACIREAGHEGPCAATPVTGVWACPDVRRCQEDGCQAKCGPGAKRRPWWKRLGDWVVKSLSCEHAPMLHQGWTLCIKCAAVLASPQDCGSPCCHYGCENSWGHRW